MISEQKEKFYVKNFIFTNKTMIGIVYVLWKQGEVVYATILYNMPRHSQQYNSYRR